MKRILLISSIIATLTIIGLISCSSSNFLGITARCRGILIDEGVGGRLVNVMARAEQGDPLAGFSVTLLPDGPTVITAEDGTFELPVVSEGTVLRFRVSGTTPDGIVIDDELEITGLPTGDGLTVEFVGILDRETNSFVAQVVDVRDTGTDENEEVQDSQLPPASSFAATPTPAPQSTPRRNQSNNDDNNDSGDDDEEPLPTFTPTPTPTPTPAPVCGNGIVEHGEFCDTSGVPTSDCDADCSQVTCGDGTLNTVAEETCDSGGVPTATCDTDCTAPSCGDGTTNTAFGEACDDFGVNTATCDFDCTAPVCGDGVENLPVGECEDTEAFCPADCMGA